MDITSPTYAAPVAEAQTKSRIAYLDGLRGIAILIVIIGHAYARWPDRIPALQPFADNPFLNTKIAGVQLFFFISGFVILMTLERTPHFGAFMLARWRRLFPAMLIASILIFATAGLLPERPAGMPRWIDLLPGLSLLGEHVWDLVPVIGRMHPKSLEGAFWSLYVEVAFYLIFGYLVIRYGASRAVTIVMWIGIASNLLILNALLPYVPFTWIARIDKLLHLSHVGSILGFKNYIWFGAGALGYLAEKANGNRRLIGLAIGSLAFGVMTSLEQPVGSAMIAVIAAAALLSATIRSILSLRVLTFIGFISYPLYLLHENAIVGFMIRYQTDLGNLPIVFLPLLPILVVGLISYVIARFGEPAVRRSIDAMIEGI